LLVVLRVVVNRDGEVLDIGGYVGGYYELKTAIYSGKESQHWQIVPVFLAKAEEVPIE